MSDCPSNLHKWETIESTGSGSSERYTERMRVPGGWLYRYMFPSGGEDGYGGTMSFVPQAACVAIIKRWWRSRSSAPLAVPRRVTSD
jgi:hypothetical protein